MPAWAVFFASAPKTEGALVLMGGNPGVGTAAAAPPPAAAAFSSCFASPAAAAPAAPNRPGPLPKDPNPPPAAGLDIKLPNEVPPALELALVLAKLPKPGAADFPPEAGVDENAAKGDEVEEEEEAAEAPNAGVDVLASKTLLLPPKTPPKPFAPPPSFFSADVGSTSDPAPKTSDPVPPLPNTGLFAGAGGGAGA